jgi:hypothetical protein
MESQNNTNTAICKNCKKSIPKINIVLHEAQCKEVVVENINANEDNILNDYEFCDKCQNYVPKQSVEDHILSHQYEHEDSEYIQPNARHSRNNDSMEVDSEEEINEEPRVNNLRSNVPNRNSNSSCNNILNISANDTTESVERRTDSNGTVTVIRTIRGPNEVTTITETRDRFGNVSTSTTTRSGGSRGSHNININNDFGGNMRVQM